MGPHVDFDDLITALAAPPLRAGKHDGTHEHHLYEGAVMVAYAMHLLRTQPTRSVRIHPDGEHGKQFDFTTWLARRGFEKVSSIGSTSYGGTYRDANGLEITVNPKSGQGDVVAEASGTIISAECKGGIINTRHSGQVSRLYKGLCETVGLLMAPRLQDGRLPSSRIPRRRFASRDAWRRDVRSPALRSRWSALAVRSST